MKNNNLIDVEKELEAIRWNRMIDRIQAICHVVGALLFIAGLAQVLYGACLIEGVDMLKGIAPCIEGLLESGAGVFLLNA